MEPDSPPSSVARPETLDPPPPSVAATPETLAPPPPSSKHAAMLQRLSDLHSSRLSSTAARHSAAPASESVAAFLARFSAARASIAASLSTPAPDLSAAAASIADLDRFLADNSYFLPPYELRSSLSALADLHHSLDSALPRRKFSFRNKSKNSGTVPEQQSPLPLPVRKPDYVISDSPGFRNKDGEVLFKQFNSAGGEFTLENLKSCDIYLKGKLRSLFVHRVYDCRVFVGPVLGSTLIDDVEGCLFMLASHQIRIHEARGTDFYLRVRSRPIVEGCSGVRFAEYRLVYEGIEEELRDSGLGDETGNWANVDDFKWLRAVQSPNWSVLPEEERVETVVATDLEEQGNAD